MATNDPISAAAALAGQTYATAPDRTAAGKKALLDQLATAGTYQNQIDTANVAAAAPQPVAPGPGDAANPQLHQLSQQGAQQVSQMGQAALSAATALAAQSRQAQSQAAGTYFDQVGAAIPIEQSRAQSEAAQIMQQLINEREERAAAAEARRVQAQIQQLQLDEASVRAAAAASGGGSGGAGAGGGGGGSEPFGGYSVNERETLKQAALNGSMAESQKWKTVNGQSVSTGRAEAVALLASNPNMSLEEAMAGRVTSPEGKRQVVEAINRYHQALAAEGFYGNSPPPQYALPASKFSTEGLTSVLGIAPKKATSVTSPLLSVLGI